MATLRETITDASTYSGKILNEARFSKLSNTDKEIFVASKNSILEIFPLNDKGKHEDMMINFAENFGFIHTAAMSTVTKPLYDKIAELETKLNAQKTATPTV